VSTSRHVTQGGVDVVEVQWRKAKKQLTGRSRLVGGDPYELRIVSGGFRPVSADAAEAGVTAELKPDGSNVRVILRSATSREVTWQVRFAEPR
jgi:hypothetical protein